MAEEVEEANTTASAARMVDLVEVVVEVDVEEIRAPRELQVVLLLPSLCGPRMSQSNSAISARVLLETVVMVALDSKEETVDKADHVLTQSPLLDTALDPMETTTLVKDLAQTALAVATVVLEAEVDMVVLAQEDGLSPL